MPQSSTLVAPDVLGASSLMLTALHTWRPLDGLALIRGQLKRVVEALAGVWVCATLILPAMGSELLKRLAFSTAHDYEHRMCPWQWG